MVGRPEKSTKFRSFLEAKCEELDRKKEARFEISFADIIAQGCPLPPSAYRHRGWWANNSSKVWVRAHFLVKKVDMQKQKVTFMWTWPGPESQADSEMREAPAPWKASLPVKDDASHEKKTHPLTLRERFGLTYTSHDKKPHPLFGAMKGTIRLVAGTDLTAPADPNWGKVYGK